MPAFPQYMPAGYDQQHHPPLHPAGQSDKKSKKGEGTLMHKLRESFHVIPPLLPSPHPSANGRDSRSSAFRILLNPYLALSSAVAMVTSHQKARLVLTSSRNVTRHMAI